jgi:alanyl-tRNA synthetase
METERKKFLTTLENGMRVLQREIEKLDKHEKRSTDSEYKELYPGKAAFLLFQSYGFPIELTQEILAEKGISVDMKEYNKEYEKHQELSRAGAEQKFKGGLADESEKTTKLHTATHLLNEALRKVLSADVKQRGSNITAERLRFDFNFDRKMTQEELQAVEAEVNRVIGLGLEVSKSEMSPDDAIAKGAQAEFGARYPAKVSVYSVGDYSMEICMGPHVNNTSELGTFRIKKEQSIAAGVRRIKAVLE